MKIVSCNSKNNAMEKFLKYVPLLLIFALFSCNKDDDNEKPEPPRDENEVYQENIQQIEDFLETHFYYLKTDPENPNAQRVAFDTIAGENADETPLMDSDNPKSKTVQPGAVEYKVYYLQVRKG